MRIILVEDKHVAMEKYVSVLKWQSIATGPLNTELELSIYDKGEYHALTFPCLRDGEGWRNVRVNRPLQLRPPHWRIWDSKRD